jgi:hypothetical protein
MAVTQQLARLDATALRKCATDVALLDALLGIHWIPQSDQLDLDWSSASLEAVFADFAAVRTALSGMNTVSPDQPKGPPTYHVDSDITCLWPDQVAPIASTLDGLDFEAAFARSADTGQLDRLFHEIDGGRIGAHGYLRRHFSNLADFYRGAAARGLAIAMWWD